MKNTVVLMRGLPGSGKDHFASLNFKDKNAVICSADDYFIRDGLYEFNQETLGAAHRYCLKKFIKALLRRDPLIVLSNTNTVYSEMRDYIEYASEASYTIRLQEPDTDWKRNPEGCYMRNCHGVSLETIQAMAKRYQTNEVVAGFAKRNLNVDVEY